jgi:hypothetical protein
MKKMKVVMSAGLVLAAVFALTLLGCPQEPEKDTIDSRLVASWTNGADGGLKKEFTIREDGTFTASINPIHVGAYLQALSGGEEAAKGVLTALEAREGTRDADTRWTVTGELVEEGDGIYIMKDLDEATGKPVTIDTTSGQPTGKADDAVVGYNGEWVRIVFGSDEKSFKFSSAKDTPNAEVENFFGGTYTKKE